MFRDFVYLDIDRVQSILAQLERGLLSELMEENTADSKESVTARVNLLAMLLPASISGTVEQGRGKSVGESKVLHDYAFEQARIALEREGLLSEDEDLDREDVPETGFVLVRGSARISDYRTLEKISANFDKVDRILSAKSGEPPQSGNRKKARKRPNAGKDNKEIAIQDADTFVEEVRKRRPKKAGRLTLVTLKELRSGCSEMATPVREAKSEVASLERRLSDLVNAAYGLTSEEVSMLWETAPDALLLGMRRRGTPRLRWCTTGVRRAWRFPKSLACWEVYRLGIRFFEVGDAGFEPATSAV